MLICNYGAVTIGWNCEKEVKKMKIIKSALLSAATLCLAVSFAFAGAGDAAKGKALFNDPNLGGAQGGKSCGTCHPDGKGLEKVAGKKEFNLGGKTHKSLEEVINMCVVNAIKGKALDPKSDQMKNLIAYINSLKGKAAEKIKKAD
jgi:cytochrome c553